MDTPPLSKIRVAIMADEFDRRPERTLYFRRLIERFIEDPTIELTLVHPKPMPDEPIYSQVREVILPRVQLPFATRFVSFIRYCLTTKDEYDIVHWLMPRPFPFFWLFPAKKRVIMAHGGGDVLLPGMRTFAREVFNYTIIWFQKHIDAMIAVSEYANKEIIYAYRMPPEKVRTIYNPVDPMYDTLPTDLERTEVLKRYDLIDTPYFVYIGRFRLHKNTGNLVRAYLTYREQHPDARELLVLGGSAREEYERTFGVLPQSPYAKDIHFIGYQASEYLPALYQGAVALVFVTLNEGFGLPVIEAMACGTPVITSSTTSLPEVAGGAGIIVDPKNPNAIADALGLVVRPEVRSLLKQRGLERSKLFTWDATYKATITLYRDLLESTPLAVDLPPDILAS